MLKTQRSSFECTISLRAIFSAWNFDEKQYRFQDFDYFLLDIIQYEMGCSMNEQGCVKMFWKFLAQNLSPCILSPFLFIPQRNTYTICMAMFSASEKLKTQKKVWYIYAVTLGGVILWRVCLIISYFWTRLAKKSHEPAEFWKWEAARKSCLDAWHKFSTSAQRTHHQSYGLINCIILQHNKGYLL